MRADDVLGRIMNQVGDNLGVRRVFGEPVERDGTTVIPVSVICGGGGSGPTDNGGAGYGGWARGVGVYAIRDGQVRFVPATDRTLLIALGMLVWLRVMARVLRRRRAALPPVCR
jgi:uncharacterized spore protein YtfJ